MDFQPAAARRRTHHDRGDFRMPPTVGQGRLGSQHVEGGRKDIGQSGGRGDRGGRQHPLGGPAAPRIENVPIPPSTMAKRLELGPRSAQRPALQPQLAEPLLQAERIAKADDPAVGLRGGSDRFAASKSRGPRRCCFRRERGSSRCRAARAFRRSDRRRNPCRRCRDSAARPA